MGSPLGCVKQFQQFIVKVRSRSCESQMSNFINCNKKVTIWCSLKSGIWWCISFCYAIMRRLKHAPICNWIISTIQRNEMCVYRRTKYCINQSVFHISGWNFQKLFILTRSISYIPFFFNQKCFGKNENLSNSFFFCVFKILKIRDCSTVGLSILRHLMEKWLKLKNCVQRFL